MLSICAFSLLQLLYKYLMFLFQLQSVIADVTLKDRKDFTLTLYVNEQQNFGAGGLNHTLGLLHKFLSMDT